MLNLFITQAVAASTTTVELVKALAWPVLALFAALVFRKPLIQLGRAIGERATKLSVFSVGVELLPAATPSAGTTLENIQREPSPAQIHDTTRMLFQQVQDNTPADYAVVDLGEGRAWLTTRLFIGAVMLRRMRGLESFVFLETAMNVDRRLLAVADARQLRWALARRFPWLEIAFARAYAETASNMNGVLPTPLTAQAEYGFIAADTGGLAPWSAGQLVGRFIESLQVPAPVAAPPPPPLAPAVPVPPPLPPIATPDSEWVTLKNERKERAQWITSRLLRELLPETSFQAWTDVPLEASRAARVRAVLLRRMPFVALVDRDRRFTRLIDRRALIEDVVRSVDQQLEGS